MKHLFRSLAVVLVAGLALVACKNDKKPANSAALDQFIEGHSYVCALADNADVLIKLDFFAVLEKSALATDPEFESLREVAFEDDESLRLLLSDPYQLGLDEKNPILLSVSNLDPDKGGDIYVTVPLTDREKFVRSVNEEDEKFVKDEDGYYVYSDDGTAAVVGERMVVAYIQTEELIDETEALSRAKAAAGKTALLANLPGMEEFFTRDDDLAFWFASEKLYNLTRSEVNDAVRKELGISFEDVMGGNPAEGTGFLMTLNSRPGELALDGILYGDNPVVTRIRSWSGTPDRDLLKFIPRDVDVAGLVCFRNLSDAAAFVQNVMNQIPDLQGYQIKTLLPTIGLTVEDLDEIGTVACGIDLTRQKGVLVASVGENVEGGIQRALSLARVSPVSRNDWKLYQPVPGVCILLGGGLLVVCDSQTLGSVGAGGYDGPTFASNPLSKILSNGIVADCNCEFIREAIDDELPALNVFLTSVRLNYFDDQIVQMVVEMGESDTQAAKSLLKLLLSVSENMVVESYDEEDDDEEDWSGFEFLMDE